MANDFGIYSGEVLPHGIGADSGKDEQDPCCASAGIPPPPPPPGSGIAATRFSKARGDENVECGESDGEHFEEYANYEEEEEEWSKICNRIDDNLRFKEGYVLQPQLLQECAPTRNAVHAHGISSGRAHGGPAKDGPSTVQRKLVQERLQRQKLGLDTDYVNVFANWHFDPSDPQKARFFAELFKRVKTRGDGNCFLYAIGCDSSPFDERRKYLKKVREQYPQCSDISALLYSCVEDKWDFFLRGNPDLDLVPSFFVSLLEEYQRLEQTEHDAGERQACLLQDAVKKNLSRAYEAYEECMLEEWFSIEDVRLYASVMNKYIVLIMYVGDDNSQLVVEHVFKGDRPEAEPIYVFYQDNHFEGLTKVATPAAQANAGGHISHITSKMAASGNRARNHAGSSIADLPAPSKSLESPSALPLAQSVSLIQLSKAGKPEITSSPDFSFPEQGMVGSICLLSLTHNMGCTRLNRRLIWAFGYSRLRTEAWSSMHSPVVVTHLDDVAQTLKKSNHGEKVCDHLALVDCNQHPCRFQSEALPEERQKLRHACSPVDYHVSELYNLFQMMVTSHHVVPIRIDPSCKDCLQEWLPKYLRATAIEISLQLSMKNHLMKSRGSACSLAPLSSRLTFVVIQELAH